MSKGSTAMRDVHSKLDWALQHHARMASVFEAYAKPGSGDDRPYGIQFLETGYTVGSVVASFMATETMPVEMSLLAADVVHNTRTALEHVLARLKEHMGGDPGAGIFPTRTSEELWLKHVVRTKKGPLDGLPPAAVDLIYREQPLHRVNPGHDPLVILNGLDNADKHELLHPAWGEPVVARGVDMIEVVDPTIDEVAQSGAVTRCYQANLPSPSAVAHCLEQRARLARLRWAFHDDQPRRRALKRGRDGGAQRAVDGSRDVIGNVGAGQDVLRRGIHSNSYWINLLKVGHQHPARPLCTLALRLRSGHIRSSMPSLHGELKRRDKTGKRNARRNHRHRLRQDAAEAGTREQREDRRQRRRDLRPGLKVPLRSSRILDQITLGGPSTPRNSRSYGERQDPAA